MAIPVGVEITVDDTGVSAGVDRTGTAIDGLGASIDKIDGKTDAAGQAFDNLGAGLAGLNTVFDTVEGSLDGFSQDLGKLPGIFDEMTAAEKATEAELSGLSASLVGLNSVFDKTEDTADALNDELKDLPPALDGVGGAAGAAGAKVATFADTFKTAKPALESIKKTGAEVSSTFKTIGVGFAAASATLVGFGGASLAAAAKFEQLEDRLSRVTGSATRATALFEQARDAAASTEFDVGGVVGASLALETFEVAAEEALPRVLALGQRFGDLGVAAQAFGKAASGSAEGFESLRNTFGISTNDLVKFGAEVNTAGGLLLRTEDQIDKARAALEKFVDVEFSEGLNQETETLTRLLSNLGDAVQIAAAEFGNVLLPAAKSAVEGLSGIAAAIGALPDGFQTALVVIGGVSAALLAVAAGAALTIAGLAGLASAGAGLVLSIGGLAVELGLMGATLPVVGTGAAGAATGLNAMGISAAATTIRLLALEAASAVAAVATTGVGAAAGIAAAAIRTAFATVASGASILGAGLVAALGPAGPLLLAAAVAAGALGLAFGAAADEAEALGKEIEKLSKVSSGIDRNYKNLTKNIQDAFGVQNDFGRDAKATQDNVISLGSALDDLAPSEVADRLARIGITAKDVATQLKEARDSAKTAGDQLIALNDIQTLLNSSSQGFRLLDDSQVALYEKFGGTLDDLNTGIQRAELNFASATQQARQLGLVDSKISPLAETMQGIANEAKSLDGLLKFSGRSEDIGTLGNSLDLINAKLAEQRKAFEASNGAGSSSVDNLLDKLSKLSAGASAERTAIEALLDLEQKRTAFQSKIATEQGKAADAAQDAISKEVDAKTKLLDADEAGLKKRIEVINSGIKAAKDGSDLELDLKKDLKDALADLDKEQTEQASDELKKRLDLVKDSIEAAGDLAGNQGANIGAEVQRGIASLNAFKVANKAAFEGSPELAKEFKDAIADMNDELKEAEAIRVSDRFDDIKQGLDALIDSATNAPDKLNQVNSAISALGTELNLAKTTEERKRITSELNSLLTQQASIVKEIEAAEKRLAGEVAALRQTAIEEEVQLLEARQAAGEGVDNALILKRDELKQARLAALQEEAQAALDAGENEGLVAERLQLKKDSINRKETIGKLGELTKQTKAAQDEATKQGKIEEDKTKKVLDEQAKRDPSRFGVSSSGFGTSSFTDFFSGFGESAFRGQGSSNSAADSGTSPVGLGQSLQTTINQQAPTTSRQDGALTAEQLQQRLDALQADTEVSLRNALDSNLRSTQETRAELNDPNRIDLDGAGTGAGPTNNTFNINLNVTGNGEETMKKATAEAVFKGLDQGMAAGAFLGSSAGSLGQ